ncbi:MAG: hypothetical protein JW791_02025 [Nanoarchaeota archaeon]|nr:hypothetical protein [Nanoarchaeota archaeon]
MRSKLKRFIGRISEGFLDRRIDKKWKQHVALLKSYNEARDAALVRWKNNATNEELDAIISAGRVFHRA